MTSAVIVEGHSTYVYCDDLVRGQSVVAADRGSRESQGQRRGGRRRRLGNGTGDRRTAGRAGRTSRRTGPAVVEDLGALHIAVNTAGGGVSARTLSKSGPHSLDAFRSVIELNLIATFNLNRLQAWHMSHNEPNDDERGVIINTSSIAAFEGQIGQVAYSAAKAAIAGMTLTMARDLGSLGIRVTAVAPSLFATGITSRIPETMASELTRDAAFPRRMGRPDEYAALALSIVENQMLNGSTIRLDAGQRFAPK